MTKKKKRGNLDKWKNAGILPITKRKLAFM
jgi:hypothetical protein